MQNRQPVAAVELAVAGVVRCVVQEAGEGAQPFVHPRGCREPLAGGPCPVVVLVNEGGAAAERLDGVADVPVGGGVKLAAARKLDVSGWMACGDDAEPWNPRIASSPLPSYANSFRARSEMSPRWRL